MTLLPEGDRSSGLFLRQPTADRTGFGLPTVGGEASLPTIPLFLTSHSPKAAAPSAGWERPSARIP
jgi:hypothetical protein